jgi:hypothetical protein
VEILATEGKRAIQWFQSGLCPHPNIGTHR